MSRILQFLLIILVGMVILLLTGALAGMGGLAALSAGDDEDGPSHIRKDAILALELEGVIGTEKDEILDLLRKYRKDDHIKAVLIRINSPGGVVGPSQEIYDEIRRTREVFKKPVYVHCGGIAASGAYYAAVGADKIYTEPGCMMGSIGALIEFVNLEGLYSWAKIKRYSVTTGKYKDAGAEYKPLAPDERALFQEMLDDVLAQFKGAIVEGRKMKPDFLNQYADGRVFTGAQAVKLGFADTLGTWDDARRELGKVTGLGDDVEVFKAKKRRGFYEFLEEASGEARFSKFFEGVSKVKFSGQPMLILPGALGH